MEKRRAFRKRLRLRVHLQPKRLTALTEDVSAVGLFLRSARVFRPGLAVELTIELPDGPVRTDGVIRWARRVPVQLLRDVRGGMGIEFSRVPPKLSSYLAETPAPPA